MTLPNHVTTICASKYFDAHNIEKLFKKGVKNFGENRTDALLSKVNALKDIPIIWHFIGHLQRNKAKSVIKHLDYLHTLDSLKLAEVIQQYRDVPLKCFIQVNATSEPQKYGISVEELPSFYQAVKKYDKIHIVGLMSMGKLDDLEVTRDAFKKVKTWSNQLSLPFVSMGMTDDYEIAIEEGTTHIRLGRYFKQYLEG